MLRGKFITFEGGEGTGKTTQISLLTEFLERKKIKVKVTREPGGGEVGEKVRAVIKSATVAKMDTLCETLLLFAARRDHYVKIIRPLLERDYVVVCDRFYDSTLVYQGLLKGASIEDIMALKRMTIGETEPDLTIILDVDSEISRQRLSGRELQMTEQSLLQDEYDAMEKEKHDIVRKGFQNIAKIFSFRAVLINASGNEKTVFSKVVREIERKFGKI